MNKMKLVGCLALTAVIAIGGWSVNPAQADKAKDEGRIATTHDLMEGLVGPTCGALGKALKAETPDWKDIKMRAALLNEAGYLLMADGRCPDAEWAKGAKTVQQYSKVVAEKASAEDLAGVQEAFKTMTSQGCGTCHKAHKK